MQVDTRPRRLTVEPLDGLLRYHVESRTGKGVYLVDLGAYGGNGFCGCPDFGFHRQPRLEEIWKMQPAAREKFLPNNAYQCIHIRRARQFLVEQVIDNIRKQDHAKPETKSSNV